MGSCACTERVRLESHWKCLTEQGDTFWKLVYFSSSCSWGGALVGPGTPQQEGRTRRAARGNGVHPAGRGAKCMKPGAHAGHHRLFSLGHQLFVYSKHIIAAHFLTERMLNTCLSQISA